MFENYERRGQRIAMQYDSEIASLEPEQFSLLLHLMYEVAHIFVDTDGNTRTREDSERMFMGLINEMHKYNECEEQ